MPFLLLLMLMLVCMPVSWQPPPEWLGTRGAALFTWGGAAGVVLAAAVLARWTRRTITRTPYRRDVALHRHLSGRFFHLIGQFVLFALDLFVIG